MFGEEAQLRAGLDLDDLTLLEEPSALLPDSACRPRPLDEGTFGEEAQLRAGLDLDDLTLLEEQSALLPDSAEFRLDCL
ncbi:Transposase [Operophtera brumata]|uniref:Transposase n=1 Tax=Operophtera brumata TaxID=104452 RepID=A0A0L7LAV2_OPEBR|nr:Transposase [Operophtera brumata]